MTFVQIFKYLSARSKDINKLHRNPHITSMIAPKPRFSISFLFFLFIFLINVPYSDPTEVDTGEGHVTDMQTLNELFSFSSTSIPPTVVLFPNEYICSLPIYCYNRYDMIVLNNYSGQISGSAGISDSQLDGEDTKVIMNLYGSGGGSITLQLLTFKNGNNAVGGALYIDDGSLDSTTVIIRYCAFLSNRATLGSLGGGAIYIGNTGFNYVSLEGVKFANNAAATFRGADVFNDNLQVSERRIEVCFQRFSAAAFAAIFIRSCKSVDPSEK